MKEIAYTFIIPHHNCPDLLDRCLKSIPTRNDIQVIVVDDNSDEGKRPVECGRTEVEYIYISKEESRGAGRARNRGLERAKGKWLLFPDSDDFYNEELYRVIDKYLNSSYDIVYLNFEYRDGKTLELLPDLPFKKYFDSFDESSMIKDEIRLHHNVPWTKMISREYVVRCGLSFEEVPNGNDILFSLLSGYFTDNITVEVSPVYVYLKNEYSITRNLKKSTDELICFVAHMVKLNYLYRYIGRKEWTVSLLGIVAYYVKHHGIKFLFTLITQGGNLLRSRKEWISLIETMENNQ